MEEKDLLQELLSELEDYLSTVNGSQSIFIATLDGHLLVEKKPNYAPRRPSSPNGRLRSRYFRDFICATFRSKFIRQHHYHGQTYSCLI